MNTLKPFTSCPCRGATDDDTAARLCIGTDDCPMTKADDWGEALRLLNEANEAIEKIAARILERQLII